jgi:hypothetical protein
VEFFVKSKPKVVVDQSSVNTYRSLNTPFELIKWIKSYWVSEDFYDKEKFNGMIQDYDAYYPNE